jgi:hypothetical protein
MRPEDSFATIQAPPGARWRIKRLFTLPLVVIAAVFVLFDDLFRSWVKPAAARLAQLPLWRRIESWIARLSPYATLTLFLIPVAIIEPLKIYALYLMGLGHVFAGVLTLVVAKVVGVGLAERLFAVSRDKLLSIRWFAWCFNHAVAIKNAVHVWLIQRKAWITAKRLVQRAKAALGRLRAWAIHARGDGRFARQVAAVRLLLAERRMVKSRIATSTARPR